MSNSSRKQPRRDEQSDVDRKRCKVVVGTLEHFCSGFKLFSLRIDPWGGPGHLLLAEKVESDSNPVLVLNADLLRLQSGIESGVLAPVRSIEIKTTPSLPVFQICQALSKLKSARGLVIQEFSYRLKRNVPQAISVNALSEFCENAPQLQHLSCDLDVQGDEEEFGRLVKAIQKCHNLRQVHFGTITTFWLGCSQIVNESSVLDFTTNRKWDQLLGALLTGSPNLKLLHLGYFLDFQVALSWETSRLLLGAMERDASTNFSIECTPSFSELSHVVKYCAHAAKYRLYRKDEGRWLFRFKAEGTGILENANGSSFMDAFVTKHGLGAAEFSIAVVASPPAGPRRPRPFEPHDEVFCVRLSNDLMFPDSIHSALRNELRHFQRLMGTPHWCDGFGRVPPYARDVLPNHDYFRVEDHIHIPNPRIIDLTKAFQEGRLWDFNVARSSKEQWLYLLRVLGSFDLTLLFDLIVSHPSEFLVGPFVGQE